jgi:hypothetical protein
VKLTARGIGLRRAGLALATAVAVALGLASAGQEPVARDEAGRGDAAAKGAPAKKGGLRVPAGAAPKGRRVARDPLVPAPPAGAAEAAVPRTPKWPFHYVLQIEADDGRPVAVDYYPAREPFQAPVLILVHESGPNRSRNDFEQAIDDLKGVSLVRHLQEQGYAVLTLDVRQAGAANAEAPIRDLQAAYRFLIDRHNRGELNLGKLGVVGVGDGANLALAWAATPGGAVSNEGRLSDLGAVVMVSPVPEAWGTSLTRVLPGVASRFALGTLCGDKDEASLGLVRENQRVLERNRQSRVSYYDTSLHGVKLLTFFPKVAADVASFLDDPVKFRKTEWEPRYLLEPVAYEVKRLEPDSGFVEPPAPPGAVRARDAGKAAAPEKKVR